MWVAWTVAGVLGFVLALMCSGRVVQRARPKHLHEKGRPMVPDRIKKAPFD